MNHTVRRNLAITASAALAAVLLAGCSVPTPTPSPTESVAAGAVLDPSAPVSAATVDAKAAALLPETVAVAGHLLYATEGGYPPYAYYAADQKTLQGFGIDLTTAIAQALGVKAQYEVTTFANFIPGVTSAKYDVAVSGIYDTTERQASVDFVDYVKDGAITLVKQGNPENLTPDTLCGKSVAASAGTASATKELPGRSDACTKAGKDPIDIQVFPSAPESLLALISGRVSAFTTGAATGYYQLTQTGGTVEPAGDAYNLAPVGLAIQKGSPLTAAIQAGLQAVVDQGVYAKILTKWNLTGSAVDCATINAATSC
ncbi:MAG: glnH 1 [Rhodoglobus sp.]|nr:glnH 1 [Rhodoglobus sp.]